MPPRHLLELLVTGEGLLRLRPRLVISDPPLIHDRAQEALPRARALLDHARTFAAGAATAS
jgi:hypothetical protein